jgi:hypothetical protein
MQPSSQLKGLVESYQSVYENAEFNHDIKILTKHVVNSIGVHMVSEGYSEQDVKDFVSSSSIGKLIERYEEASENPVVTSQLNEEGIFETHLKYIEGAVATRLFKEAPHVEGRIKKELTESIGSVASKFKPLLKRGLEKLTGYGAKAKKNITLTDPTGTKRKIGLAGATGATVADPEKAKERVSGALGSTTRVLGATGSAIKKELEGKNKKQTYEETEWVEIDEQTVLAQKKGKWVALDKSTGKTTEVAPTPQAIQRYRNIQKARAFTTGGLPQEDPKKPVTGRPAPAPATRPAAAPAPTKPAAAPAPTKPAAAPAPATRPAATAPKPTVRKKAEPPKVKQTGDPEKDYATWTKSNKALAKKVKPGQAGYEVIQKTLKTMGEDVDHSDNAELNILIDFLFTEGYANTLEGAFSMIENMSDEWINEILDLCQLESAMLEYLVVMGEADTLDEARYILSVMDEEAIDILAEQVVEVNS